MNTRNIHRKGMFVASLLNLDLVHPDVVRRSEGGEASERERERERTLCSAWKVYP